jgi:hypothetical protein
MFDIVLNSITAELNRVHENGAALIATADKRDLELAARMIKCDSQSSTVNARTIVANRDSLRFGS